MLLEAAGATSTAPVYVAGSGSGVFLSSPGANATLNSSAHLRATAYSPNQITALQIYDNGGLGDDGQVLISPEAHQARIIQSLFQVTEVLSLIPSTD